MRRDIVDVELSGLMSSKHPHTVHEEISFPTAELQLSGISEALIRVHHRNGNPFAGLYTE